MEGDFHGGGSPRIFLCGHGKEDRRLETRIGHRRSAMSAQVTVKKETRFPFVARLEWVLTRHRCRSLPSKTAVRIEGELLEIVMPKITASKAA